MAIASTTYWSIDTAATSGNVNSGGFNINNANFMTDLACDAGTGNTASPVVSSATYTFVAGDVGSWIWVKSGTSWTTGWYKIASVAGGKATLLADIGQAVQMSNATGTYSDPAANIIAGCATIGTAVSGTFGVDYSQGTSVFASGSDLTAPSGPTASPIASATVTFTPNFIGNLIHVISGTRFTAGWYEIVSVSGGNATLDRTLNNTGLGATGGVFNVGGALSLGSANDGTALAVATAGNRLFVKSGTYTIGSAITMTGPGPIQESFIFGYKTLRGDTCNGTDRPLFNIAANNLSLVSLYNIQFKGTSGLVATGYITVNCKFSGNTSAPIVTVNSFVLGCEFNSLTGTAVYTNTAAMVVGSYIHDSKAGLRFNSSNNFLFMNIFEGCYEETLYIPNNVPNNMIIGNTFYGSENKLAIGANFLGSGDTQVKFFNNIFYGFVTAVSRAAAGTFNETVYTAYNAFFNNTTNLSFIYDNGNNLISNPTFTSVGQYTGTTATVSGFTLTDTGANFSNVVDNQTFCYIVSGTGATVGQYLITSHTSTVLTFSTSPGTNATADKTYQITYGKNFAVGTNMKYQGFPRQYGVSNTNTYVDIGASQLLKTTPGTAMSPFVGG